MAIRSLESNKKETENERSKKQGNRAHRQVRLRDRRGLPLQSVQLQKLQLLRIAVTTPPAVVGGATAPDVG
jgi:hypothetical protein